MCHHGLKARWLIFGRSQALTRVSLSSVKRKIEGKKRNFSLDLENFIVSISLSTLNFREFDTETLVFSRFFRV